MEKSLVLSVSIGTGCYRHIQIGEKATIKGAHPAGFTASVFGEDKNRLPRNANT
jgi:hypothetical protein